MSRRDEPWVRAAMSDDTVVAEILLRLHASSSPAANPKPLNWAVRQRRSKLLPRGSPKKTSDRRRASPSTPLSWSAGSEESTRSCVHVSRISDSTRSKVNNEGSSEKAISNQLRKRKTVAELRNDESLLLKERRELKREITALRTSLETQWSENENLKRMRIDLQQPLTGYEVISPIASPTISKDNVSLQQPSRFVIPDLNIPLEEDINVEV